MSGPISLLAAAPVLTRYDASRWVLQCPSGHQVLLNTASADLLRVVAEAPSFAQGCQRFNEQFAATFSPTDFEQLVHERFGGYQLLATEKVAVRPPVGSHIQFQLQLLTARWAGRLAAPLTRLYSPPVFWPLLAGLSASLSLLAWAHPFTLSTSTGVQLAGLFYGSMLVHEFGHIAACRRAGLAHGGIGVGFYLLIPVLYADVTAIWQAPRQQRIIANLGGIFSQLLYAAVVAGVGLVLHAPAWLLTAQAITISAAWQLNPFVRHDGYWLVADYTNTPNLLAKAQRVRRQVLSREGLRALRTGSMTTLAGSRWGWLLAYGSINTLVMVAFLSVVLRTAGPAILHFPALLPDLFSKLVHGTLARPDFPAQTLTVLAFYGLLIRVFVLPSALRALARRKASPQPG